MNYVDEVKEELSKHLTVGKGLTNMYALLVLIKGESCTLEDVHDAWAVNINMTWDKESNGQHRSMIWFNKLSVETQEKDRHYLDAIHTTARILRERRER